MTRQTLLPLADPDRPCDPLCTGHLERCPQCNEDRACSRVVTYRGDGVALEVVCLGCGEVFGVEGG